MASDLERRRYACEGKFGFVSAAVAKKVGRRMRGRDKNAHAYRCEFCQMWHLGSHQRVRPLPKRERPYRGDEDAW